MKKKNTLKIIGIVATAISGTILTIATGGLLAVPSYLVTIASVTGAIGTAVIAVDEKLNGKEKGE